MPLLYLTRKILKTNKKIKQVEKIEKDKNIDKEKINHKENYIVKEAEMLVSNYFSKLEEKKELKIINNKKKNKKYIRLRNYAFITSLIIFVESVILVIR